VTPGSRVDRRFSLASAQRAASLGRTAEWVGLFLASAGSDNDVLAAALARRRHRWYGPVQVPVDDLTRLAGPEPDALIPIMRHEWEDDVGAMEESLDEGWEPPPLLVEWHNGDLLVQDGTHRFEAMRREGATEVWVLVYSDDPFAGLDDRLHSR
jgi:hypothetical protein